jgi:hypothetical protein
MAAKGLAVVVLVALGCLVGGCAGNGPGGMAGNTVTLTGVVKLMDGQTSRGFGVPNGYQLIGQPDYSPLMLQNNGTLTDPMFGNFEGQRVQVSGNLNMVERPRVETEDYSRSRHYWVLDVKSINPAQ